MSDKCQKCGGINEQVGYPYSVCPQCYASWMIEYGFDKGQKVKYIGR